MLLPALVILISTRPNSLLKFTHPTIALSTGLHFHYVCTVLVSLGRDQREEYKISPSTKLTITLEISSTTFNLDNAALALPNKKSSPRIENLFPNAEGADGFIDDVIVQDMYHLGETHLGGQD